MRCDICESKDSYIKNHKHTYVIKGKKITFFSNRKFCTKCNNLIYDQVLDNEASKKAIALYNKNYGITKEQIINLRKQYGLSLELFSKIIGCAKKTLISYEKGTSIPNDCYLTIIKSLLVKPEAILTFVDVNKEQFTGKEYEKISSKLSLFIPNNTKGLASIENPNLNEYNGYTKFNKEKVYNMILYFAKNGILKTKLLKEMFYADFVFYKNNCRSITGLEYAKLPYGPVPDQFEEILSIGIKEGYINYDYTFEENYECHNIKSIKFFDKKIFDEEELNTLKIIEEKFKNFGSKEIADFSHKEKAYTENEISNKISYDFAFNISSI